MGLSAVVVAVTPTEEQPSGRAALVEALEVQKNLKRGAAIGVGFTAIIFLVFVVFPPATVESPVYYIALAFVLALSTTGLAATVLVMRRAYRLSKEL